MSPLLCWYLCWTLMNLFVFLVYQWAKQTNVNLSSLFPPPLMSYKCEIHAVQSLSNIYKPLKPFMNFSVLLRCWNTNILGYKLRLKLYLSNHYKIISIHLDLSPESKGNFNNATGSTLESTRIMLFLNDRHTPTLNNFPIV